MSSRHPDGDARRTRAAGDRDRREAVDELILLVGDQIVEHQVLVIDDAVLGLQRHVDRKRQRLVGLGTTSTAQVSAPVMQRSFSITQFAISRPMPGSPLLNLSLF